MDWLEHSQYKDIKQYVLLSVQHTVRHIRKCLYHHEYTQTLIHAFITSRLDYCGVLLYGLSEHQLHKLQQAMNACARIVFCASKFCHITLLWCELHWLPVHAGIKFKIIFIIFNIVHGIASDYYVNLLPYIHLLPCVCKHRIQDSIYIFLNSAWHGSRLYYTTFIMIILEYFYLVLPVNLRRRSRTWNCNQCSQKCHQHGSSCD